MRRHEIGKKLHRLPRQIRRGASGGVERREIIDDVASVFPRHGGDHDRRVRVDGEHRAGVGDVGASAEEFGVDVALTDAEVGQDREGASRPDFASLLTD